MKGADEYYDLFPTGQYGRLYILRSKHARGKTFQIFVLPKGEEAENRHFTNPPTNNGTVEVYGVISGQLGWDESYGWLYGGPWQKDFDRMVADKIAFRESELYKATQEMLLQKKTDKQRKIDLLFDYKEGDSE